MSGTAKVFEWDEQNNMILQTADGNKHIIFDADNAELRFKLDDEESTLGIHNNIPEIITTSSETAPTDTNVYSALASDNKYLSSSAIIQAVGSEPSTSNVYSALSSNSLYLKKDSLISDSGTPSIESAYNSQASENLYFKKSNIIGTSDIATVNNAYSASASNSLYMLNSNIETTSSAQDSNTKVYSVKAVNTMITNHTASSPTATLDTAELTVDPSTSGTTSNAVITVSEEANHLYIYDVQLVLTTASTEFESYHVQLTDTSNHIYVGTLHPTSTTSSFIAKFSFMTKPSVTADNELSLTVLNSASSQFVLTAINTSVSSCIVMGSQL